MSIHTEGKSRSDPCRVLVLNDPAPGRIEDDFDEDMPPGGPEGDEGESDSEGDSEVGTDG